MFRRYELLQAIAPVIKDQLVVCNIGFPSQELYEIDDQPTNFYMLGSMGLSSSIGLGLSMTTSRGVVSIDGDGSVLMNLGTLSTIAHQAPPSFVLLIVDNGAYGSTGDQPTYTSGKTDLAAIARAAGIDSVIESTGDGVVDALRQALDTQGPHVIVAKVEPGSPKLTPIPMPAVVIRDRFMRSVRS